MLLVDGDADSRDLHAWRLRAAGWVVEAFSDGKQALFATAESAPDVVVTDLQLPGLGGLELTRMLRRHPRIRSVPVVVCTAAGGDMAEHLAREAGCDAYVRKPCPPDELLHVLERVVRAERTAV